MTAGPGPTLSVVVPTFDGRTLLPLVLGSLREQRRAPDEVIVVDDGSADGTVGWLAGAYPEATVIELSENAGFARAVNRGIAAAGGTYVALVNNDVELHPGWTQAMMDALERIAGAGSAASRMLGYADRTVVDGCGDALAWSGIALPRGHGTQDGPRFDPPEEVFGARAGAALYRRSALDDVGGFDEAFFAFSEDVDWALRARLRGWSCWYVPEALAFHVGGASSTQRGQMTPRFYAMNRRNAIWTVVHGFPTRTLIRRLPWLLAGQGLQAAVSVRDGRLDAQLSAWGQALRGLRRALRRRRTVQAGARVDAATIDAALSPGLRPR